jgi:hypothetical protein
MFCFVKLSEMISMGADIRRERGIKVRLDTISLALREVVLL